MAGGGRVPVEIAQAAEQSGRDVHIVAIDRSADKDIAEFPHDRIGIGQIGQMLAILRAQHCHDLIIAGSLTRPDLFALRIDWGFVRNLPRIIRLMRGGDDSVLRRVISFFEAQGFNVCGIAEIAPQMLGRSGAMTVSEPNQKQLEAISQGYQLVRRLGPYDVGQGVVMRGNELAAVEAAEGTDAMLQRLVGQTVTRGVLVKAAKPGQELRVDLPTIGPDTIRNAVEAGLDCIAIESGRSVLADRAETLSLAGKHRVCIYGITPDQNSEEPAIQPKASKIERLGRRAVPKQAATDIDLALRIQRSLYNQANVDVVVRHDFALAIGIQEDPVALIDRAAARTPWGAGRRRAGIVALCDTDKISSDTIAAAARANLLGVLVADENSSSPKDGAIAQADTLGLFIAGVHT